MSLVTPCLYFPFYAANVFLPVETIVYACVAERTLISML